MTTLPLLEVKARLSEIAMARVRSAGADVERGDVLDGQAVRALLSRPAAAE